MYIKCSDVVIHIHYIIALYGWNFYFGWSENNRKILRILFCFDFSNILTGVVAVVVIVTIRFKTVPWMFPIFFVLFWLELLISQFTLNKHECMCVRGFRFIFFLCRSRTVSYLLMYCYSQITHRLSSTKSHKISSYSVWYHYNMSTHCRRGRREIICLLKM